MRLKTRGETIREVLEKYLDDDDDMKDMNLTAKWGPLSFENGRCQTRSRNETGPIAEASPSLHPWMLIGRIDTVVRSG